MTSIVCNWKLLAEYYIFDDIFVQFMNNNTLCVKIAIIVDLWMLLYNEKYFTNIFIKIYQFIIPVVVSLTWIIWCWEGSQ